MRVDQINEIANKCMGCMACVDICPINCIVPNVRKDGFLYSAIDGSKCINCGKCGQVCPIETKNKNSNLQHLYAAYSKEKLIQSRGSSGGIFELLAEQFLTEGYYICGAAFDEAMQLKHQIVNSKEDLLPLLKSKYLQSNMTGVYNKIKALLLKGEKVFFCGTPCQVSALKNCISAKFTKNLFTADIICHGVPSQKLFDEYLRFLGQEEGGEIQEFRFRVKNNRYKHAHGYSYVIKRDRDCQTKNGVYSQSSYYNAFKNYLIFRDSCYNCQYSTIERVSDITLGDFWGIEKYNFKGNTDKGVSMVITNTLKGESAFGRIGKAVFFKEFPLEDGIKTNYSLTNTTQRPLNRDVVIKIFTEEGYEATAKKYFNSGKRLKYRLYWFIPPRLRNVLRKLRGK